MFWKTFGLSSEEVCDPCELKFEYPVDYSIFENEQKMALRLHF